MTTPHAENKIDEMVYELYGLTEEEIGIVAKVKKIQHDPISEQIPCRIKQ